MSNFEKQMAEAIKTYAEISGVEVSEVVAACADIESQTARNVMLLMAAAA